MPFPALRLASLALVACFTFNLHAQQGPPGQANNGPSGTVTGTVLAQETQKPVRFAQVQFQSVVSVNGENNGRNFGGGNAQTEADGTFSTTMPPGDYYVTASALGFVPERSLLQAAVAGGADPGQLLASLPVVHVAVDGTSNINVTLQRGGTLSGQLVWEDGSPAAGVQVTAVATNQASQKLPGALENLELNGFGLFSASDDRGDFRISGLPSGDYALQAVIQSRGPFGMAPGIRGAGAPSALRVYAPGVFRKSGAKVFSVRAGDDTSDVRMTIDMGGLRIVSGRATSSNAGQNVASGRVTLTDANDSSLTLQGSVDATGSFTVRYVPPGNYTLAISGASTRPINRRDTSNGPVVSFQQSSQAIVVTDTDLTGVVATLTPSQSR